MFGRDKLLYYLRGPEMSCNGAGRGGDSTARNPNPFKSLIESTEVWLSAFESNEI